MNEPPTIQDDSPALKALFHGDRPLVFFDLETTGTDPAKDRIVELAMVKYRRPKAGGLANHEILTSLIRPPCPIPPAATAVHGITDVDVKDKPAFLTVAGQYHDFVKGCDLAGYNLRGFDIPCLWEEFCRAGIVWDLDGICIIDAGEIFKKKEERTLEAAMRFFCGQEHIGAHGAAADCHATAAVLIAQIKRYADLMTMDRAALDKASRHDDDTRVDLAGKIRRNEQGEPVYAIGKAKGVRVVDDPGFGHWMLRNDFGEETKRCIRKLLEGKNSNQPEIF